MSESKSKIWLSSPQIGGNELNYFKRAMDFNHGSHTGSNVDYFERSLSEFCNRKHCSALNSGTSALHLALIVLDIGPGDYVICQSLNFAASAFAITYLGATPVFIDSETDTWNMDPVLLEKAIVEINERSQGDKRKRHGGDKKNLKPQESGKTKIKAIIPVHVYGMPAKMQEILAISKKYDIPVIENAAEAFGSKYFNRPAGSMGEMSILSFNGNMLITTSEGGALLTDRKDLATKACKMLSHSEDYESEVNHVSYNYGMSQVSAGIGLGQLEVFNKKLERRRVINQFYRNNLAGISGITFQTEPSSDFFSNYWLTAITIDQSLTCGITSEAIRKEMSGANIEVVPIWKPLHIQPVFAGSPAFLNGKSENLFEQGLCLPCGSDLNEDELKRVINVIFKSFNISKSKRIASGNKAA
jgi:dTDP-4-amino-4,6-dideoxygalactose transaminase